MQIQLDNDMLKSVVAEAIMKSLDEKKRDALVQGAIQHLLAPSEMAGYYGRKTSPIQDAFNQAVSNVATQLARETLEKDEAVQAKIRSLLADAMTQMFETNRDATVTRIAAAIESGLTRDR